MPQSHSPQSYTGKHADQTVSPTPCVLPLRAGEITRCLRLSGSWHAGLRLDTAAGEESPPGIRPVVNVVHRAGDRAAACRIVGQLHQGSVQLHGRSVSDLVAGGNQLLRLQHQGELHFCRCQTFPGGQAAARSHGSALPDCRPARAAASLGGTLQSVLHVLSGHVLLLCRIHVPGRRLQRSPALETLQSSHRLGGE